MADFKIAQGDTLPPIIATLLGAGVPVDLSGATVTLSVSTATSTPLFKDRPVSVTDPVGGAVLFDWQSGDTNKSGQYTGQFNVVFANGEQHFPNNGFFTININPSLL